MQFHELAHVVEHFVVLGRGRRHLLDDGRHVTEDGGVQQRCRTDGAHKEPKDGIGSTSLYPTAGWIINDADVERIDLVTGHLFLPGDIHCHQLVGHSLFTFTGRVLSPFCPLVTYFSSPARLPPVNYCQTSRSPPSQVASCNLALFPSC